MIKVANQDGALGQPGLLRNRAFLLLLTSMSVSQVGHALHEMILPIWVMSTTGSAKSMALITGVSTAVRLLVAPVAGTIADRSDRRRVMLGADLARSAILLLLALAFWTKVERIELLLAGYLLLAFAGAFFSPAYAAAQTGLVHPQDLTQSLSIWQMVRQAIAFIGPPAAGLIVGLAGYAGALALDGLTFLFSVGCLLLVQLRWAPAVSSQRAPFWRDFRAGLSTLVDSPIVLRTLLLASGVNLAGAAFAILLPVIALREMALPPTVYGLFQMVSPAGVMLGMLLLTAIAGRIARRGRFILRTLLAMGLANVAMGWATQPTLFVILLFAGGLFFGLSNVMFADIWRRLIPAEQQGRFFGMQGSLNQVLAPVGVTLTGLLADQTSPYAIAAGAGALVVALAIWGLAAPGLRDLA